MGESNRSPDDYSDDELTTIARMLAVSHKLLYHGHYFGFVSDFLDLNYEAAYIKAENENGGRNFVGVKFLALNIFAYCLPLIYAHTAMEYKCDFEKMNMKQDSLESEISLAGVNCRVENWLRSPWSLTLGPLSVLASVVIWGLFQILACFFGAKARSVGRNVRRLVLNHLPVGVKLRHLKYHRDAPVLGKHVKDNFFFQNCCVFYVLLLLEMVVIAVMHRSGTALVLAKVLGDVYLHAANTILSPCDEVIVHIEGELDRWEYAPEPGLWIRIRDIKLDILYVTSAELQAVYENMPALLDEVTGEGTVLMTDQEREDIQKGEDEYIWKAMQIQNVYVVDMDNKTIPVVVESESENGLELCG